MKTDTLSIIANRQKLGAVSYQGNRISFRYAPSWQESPGAFPLSVSPASSRATRASEITGTFDPLMRVPTAQCEAMLPHGRALYPQS